MPPFDGGDNTESRTRACLIYCRRQSQTLRHTELRLSHSIQPCETANEITVHSGIHCLHVWHAFVEPSSCAIPSLFSTNRVPSRRVTVVVVDRSFWLKDLMAEQISFGRLVFTCICSGAFGKFLYDSESRDGGGLFSVNRNSSSIVDWPNGRAPDARSFWFKAQVSTFGG